MMKHFNYYLMALPLLAGFLISCSTQEADRITLASIDIENEKIITDKTLSNQKVSLKSAEEVKAAYYQYLKNASTNDSSRQLAISRLAQMELELTNKLLSDDAVDELEEDAVYTATLQRTIKLLTTSLNDFPDAKGNDALLYQLARTYDQVGEYDLAMQSLEELTEKYKNSVHYAEAQFRIGEAAFAQRDYLSAEDAYTEAIISPNSERFYEKAFFKRGWTRYKQELYIESVDDYIESLALHRFGEQEDLTKNEKALFDEHFRAIGLAFSHLDGATALRDYFSSDSNFRYLYHTYATISDIYLKQERFADAADALQQFIEYHKDKSEVPIAQLKIIDIWQQSGFVSRVHLAIEDFYKRYNPSSSYWANNQSNKYQQQTIQSLKQLIADEASFYHSRYQDKSLKKEGVKNFQTAALWYERYLEYFSDFGRKEGIYLRFGELLYSQNNFEKALDYLEIAAYDQEIILDKEAAYLTIDTTNKILAAVENDDSNRKIFLDKLIKLSLRYIELYPQDIRSEEIGLYAAQLAFNEKDYQNSLVIVDAFAFSGDGESLNDQKENFYQINLIKARSLFELSQFSDAELTYQAILTKPINSKRRREIEDNLALSIYRQAELAKSSNDISQALHHFSRIHQVVPKSDISASALYDAVTIAMNNEQWSEAIQYGDQFKRQYGKHKFANDVTKQLSIAYLNSDQGDKAAQAFERISSFEKNEEVKMTALWQAATLYEKKGDISGAIRTYRDFAHKYKQKFSQNMEAMHKLTTLYEQKNEPQKRFFWLRKISAAGRRATGAQKTQRTTFLASMATLEVANELKREFESVRLKAPLQKNLRRKKTLMQEAIKFYGQASSFGLADITTEATFSIGKIYQEFSISLLDSERPANLSGEELEQYEILLEDQAFPFEDKAIEFYETNIARSKTGLYNTWLSQSRSQLAELFPVRYSRKPRLEGYLQP